VRAPLSWLRDYAPLDAPTDRLASVLSGLGLVVDAVEEIGGGPDGVVVAQVLSIRAHPEADRVRLVDVDPGDGGPLQIVCGAWNFGVGDLVPLAPVGTVLPGGEKIKRSRIRGQESNGMLCSAPELGLPAAGKADGLLVLPAGLAPPGAALSEALGLRPDVVYDLDITPNRPDALCMAGVARDLAAALGETWAAPAAPLAPPVDPQAGSGSVEVEAGDLCPRFSATVITGVPSGPSTPEVARRLTLAGMRPINAVVDVSNYVMLDLGQPNHAYDLDRLGGGGLRVRRARPGETLVTLDGVERTLEPDDCVIADAAGRAVGVAGIMGGESAEIGDWTRRVLLECAWFEPRAVARTGNRLGLHSEARARFERGVDPDLALAAVERFCALLAATPGGEGLRRGPTTDRRHPSLPGPGRIRLRPARVAALLGAPIGPEEVRSLLQPLGFEVAGGGEAFDVTVPTWRLEVAREADLIEEVARMWGYQRIERTFPAGARARAGGLSPLARTRRRVRAVLAGAGLFEAWTSTFLSAADLERAGLDPGAVEVANPLDRSESALRTSLRPGLLAALRRNVDRQLDALALFEVGRVFAPPGPWAETPRPEESERVAAAVLPPTGAGGTAAVASAVAAWRWLAGGLRLARPGLEARDEPGLHPGRSAVATGNGAVLGSVGEVDPEVVKAFGLPGPVGWLELDLAGLHAADRQPDAARDPSRYPASDVDLAFVLAERVPASTLVDALSAAAAELVEEATLFDVFRGERLGPGRRSLAVRVRLRAPDRTLDDAELADIRARLVAAGEAAGGELRR
jgi:phenylalanyl-tRNA synthetase beta chain